MNDDWSLLDVSRIDEVAALLGSELSSVLAESHANLARNLGILDDPPSIDAFTRASHAIASASLQLGMSRLGEDARKLERTAPSLSVEDRAAAARTLRELATRSRAALEAHLAR
ncbi:MAG: hypothetical protein K1X94_16065 [Sandaracinaceae bacterium]|jgi:HPt (histidine-containing phosphotransfer) domain-containing protein|nr:hypothetical protein [Sandaracinaceae bacterium]